MGNKNKNKGKENIDKISFSSNQEIGFHCRDYGDFLVEQNKHSYFSITKGSKESKEKILKVTETQDSARGRVVMNVNEYNMTLKEYLSRYNFSYKRASRYGSDILYPTDAIKSLIQGVVTAVLNFIRSGRQHNYLLNTENIILHFEKTHPYSEYVTDYLANNKAITQNITAIKSSGYNETSVVKVSLVHVCEDGEQIEDLKALKKLIFDRILEVDKYKDLPKDWEEFEKTFDWNPLPYYFIASHPCMWSYLKRVKYFSAVHDWYFKASDELQSLINITLETMPIFKENWLKRAADYDPVLKKIKENENSSYHASNVYSLITFFRNTEQHAREIGASLRQGREGNMYEDKRYLEYILGLLFPNLIWLMHFRLLKAGFVYPSY